MALDQRFEPVGWALKRGGNVFKEFREFAIKGNVATNFLDANSVPYRYAAPSEELTLVEEERFKLFKAQRGAQLREIDTGQWIDNVIPPRQTELD